MTVMSIWLSRNTSDVHSRDWLTYIDEFCFSAFWLSPSSVIKALASIYLLSVIIEFSDCIWLGLFISDPENISLSDSLSWWLDVLMPIKLIALVFFFFFFAISPCIRNPIFCSQDHIQWIFNLSDLKFIHFMHFIQRKILPCFVCE